MRLQKVDAAAGCSHAGTVTDVLDQLQSDGLKGLSGAEAKLRLERFGRNELPGATPVPGWRKFLAQFADVLVILLVIAGLISAVLWMVEQDSALPYEAIAIFAIVILNAVMGHLQQTRAEEAVAALREMSAAQAKVLRDGRRQTVPAAEVVPGDIALIEEGDTVAADARLIEVAALQMAEAALTGESQPVAKQLAPVPADSALGDRSNMIFSGTAATYGHGRAVITATGTQTEMGHIAGLLERARAEVTPLQMQLDRVGRLLAIIVVGIAVVMIATILTVTEVGSLSAVFDVLILGVALAVAAVPEGLPAVVTAVLSIGVQRMARRNAIVRHLAAVETLGAATVIASDKTGTLTRNEMTVRAVLTACGRVNFTGSGYAPEGEISCHTGQPLEEVLRTSVQRALIVAERANNAVVHQQGGQWRVQGDPTEGALIVAARKAGLDSGALDLRFARRAEVPFSSERKLMSTIHSDADADRILALTKGAPDVLLARCAREMVGEEERPLTDDRRAAILASNEALAGEALRTLGVAFRALPAGEAGQVYDHGVEQDLCFLGLIGMIDPPRPEARDAVARARRAGIRPIMITGDHPVTALVIATELGIATDARAVTGKEIQAMSEAELDRAVAEVSVFARVDPEHKLRIVDALQRSGMTVAMTGDGVNDAPALKTADIGIAMGITGTDVSQEAADMVLTDDNFATIVAAVEVGRSIFSNIRKFLRYLLSSNIGEVMTMFLGVILGPLIGLGTGAGGVVVLPLLATQILWINLVTDGAPALALGIDPPDARVMDRKPRPRSEPVITRRMWQGIFFVGAVMAAGTLYVLDAALPGGLVDGTGTLRYGQTMAFTTLMLFQLFNAFNARSDDRSAFDGLFQNGWLWAAVGLSLVLHACVIYVPFLQQAFSTFPLAPRDWLTCTVVASTVLWLREATKLAARMRRG